MKYVIFLFLIILSSCTFKFTGNNPVPDNSQITNAASDSSGIAASSVFNQQNLISQSSDNAIDIPRAQPLRFYESYESFKANNPLPNYEIYRKETVGGIEVVNFKKVSADKGFEVIDFDRLRVRKEGKEMRLKPKEYPSLLFTDENGLLHRKVVEGGSYLIFIKGKYCYYLNASNRHVKKGPYGELFMSGLRPSGANASYVTYYWSLGIDGLVKEIKDKDFIKELEKYNLDKDFKSKNPKRDLVLKLDYYEKKHEVYVEFFNLLNQKQKM